MNIPISADRPIIARFKHKLTSTRYHKVGHVAAAGRGAFVELFLDAYTVVLARCHGRCR